MRISLQSPLSWWHSLDSVQRSFWLLAMLRVVIVALFLANIPPLALRWRWFLHHGGDQNEYLALARSLAEGHPQRSLVGIGQALVMLPWVVWLKPYNYFDIIVPLVIINGFLLGGLSVVAVGGLARRITGQDTVATLTAAIWATLPTLTYYIFFWHFDWVTVRSANVPKVGWINGLSDGPTIFALMVAVLLLARGLHDGTMPARRLTGVGVALGLAVMFRVHVATAALFLFFYVLVAYGWRALGVALLAAVVTYLPQAWYNMTVYGTPVTTGYLSNYFATQTPEQILFMLHWLPFHPNHWAELWAYYIGRRPWLVIPLGAASLVGVYSLIALWRARGWRAVALLHGTALAYIIPMSSAWPFRDDVIRFSMPALPLAIVASTYTLWAAWSWVRALGLRQARPLDIPSQG